MADTETEEKEDKNVECPPKPIITESTTKVSSSTSNLLSAGYNPTPKKDELVQNASIRILEVENLLDKLNYHIDKHHRKSSQKLQDFEQIHTELSKIQCTLIDEEQATNNHSNPRIDPFIVIASTDDDDDDKYNDEKDDEKQDKKIHHSTLSQLEPFQSLVSKIQKEMEPNHTSITSSDTEMKQKLPLTKRNSIKVKQSELVTIHDYVNQHRHKMKEKTIQYEEKKKQLLSAKERLNKAKARFRKRLNKSKNRKERNRNRTHSEHTKIRNMRYHKHKHPLSAQITSVSQTSSPVVHIIKENIDEDGQPTLSLANLSKLNATTASELSSLENRQKHSNYLLRGGPLSPSSRVKHGLGVNPQHSKSHTGSSIQSSFSVLSDQSFVEDFHSITAELESIDDIVRTQVKSPSMTSIFSDLASGSPEDGHSSKFGYNEQHIKNNIPPSSISADSESNPKRYQSYASSTDNSLQSELCQLQDIESQIGDL